MNSPQLCQAGRRNCFSLWFRWRNPGRPGWRGNWPLQHLHKVAFVVIDFFLCLLLPVLLERAVQLDCLLDGHLLICWSGLDCLLDWHLLICWSGLDCLLDGHLLICWSGLLTEVLSLIIVSSSLVNFWEDNFAWGTGKFSPKVTQYCGNQFHNSDEWYVG